MVSFELGKEIKRVGQNNYFFTFIIHHIFFCNSLLRFHKSGVYPLSMDVGEVPVYCHMTLPACGEGQWTSVMKIDGAKVLVKQKISLRN